MAGSPCPIETMKRVVAKMHLSAITIAYGMTETSRFRSRARRQIHSTNVRRPSAVSAAPRSEGRRRDGKAVPIGVTGELWTKGYSVMLGYWDDEARTGRRSLTLDAYGGLATIDSEGYCNMWPT